MKKIVSVLLASSLLLCSACSIADGSNTNLNNEYMENPQERVTAYYQDGTPFTPVLRFVVTGDTHVGESWTANMSKRFENVFTDAYAYAKTQEYDKLDAVVVVGDYVERGYESEYKNFLDAWQKNIMPETSFLCLQAGHELIKGDREDHTLYTGNDMGMHVKINGYHFILISNQGETGKNEYPDEACDLEWIEDSLEDAKAETGEMKPIFTFHHHPIVNTIMASETGEPGWYSKPVFQDLFTGYSNLVDFSAHTHIWPGHPRSIMQKDFTTLSAGASYYVSETSDYPGNRTVIKDSQGTAGAFTVVEVDKDGRIRMLPYNLGEREFMTGIGKNNCEEQIIRYIERAGDKSTWLYTENRNDATDLPEFSSTATVKKIEYFDSWYYADVNTVYDPEYITKTKGMVLTFDAAIDLDGIECYEMYLYNKATGRRVHFYRGRSAGGTLASSYVDSLVLTGKYHVSPIPNTLTVRTSGVWNGTDGYGLEKGETYILNITPIDAWHNKGEALVYEFVY